MRTRKQIEDDIVRAQGNDEKHSDLVFEVFLDIRELLEKQKDFLQPEEGEEKIQEGLGRIYSTEKKGGWFFNSKGEIQRTENWGSKKHIKRRQWGNDFETREKAKDALKCAEKSIQSDVNHPCTPDFDEAVLAILPILGTNLTDDSKMAKIKEIIRTLPL